MVKLVFTEGFQIRAVFDFSALRFILVKCSFANPDFFHYRVIFRWLATKNLKEMSFDNVQPGSPEEVLMGLKTGRTTYAMVFDTMCK